MYSATTVAAMALGTELPGRDRGPSDSLQALTEAHRIAYAALGEALHESDRAGWEEQSALLAICGSSWGIGPPAKALCLLAIEARGELDLPDICGPFSAPRCAGDEATEARSVRMSGMRRIPAVQTTSANSLERTVN